MAEPERANRVARVTFHSQKSGKYVSLRAVGFVRRVQSGFGGTTMLKLIKVGVAASLLVAGMATAGMPSGRNFTVKNTNSKVSIQRVWYARAGEEGDPWHEVMLDYAVKPGTTSNFTMGTGDICLYDIKVQFSDAYVQQRDNINVCRGDTAVFT